MPSIDTKNGTTPEGSQAQPQGCPSFAVPFSPCSNVKLAKVLLDVCTNKYTLILTLCYYFFRCTPLIPPVGVVSAASWQYITPRLFL